MKVAPPLPAAKCELCGALLGQGLLDGRRVSIDLGVRVVTPVDARALPTLATNALSFAVHADVCPYRND